MSASVHEQESVLKWTAKVPLSRRIIDPLGIYILKHLESYFIPGITTQTDRLRYFSLIPWIIKTVANKKLKSNKILHIEKIVTLAAALHHINDSSPPNGIRSREYAKEFLLQSNESIQVSQYTRFGRENKIGYGNYYYRGPLATLQICGKKANEYIFSEVGEQIVDLFGKVIGSNVDLLLKNRLSKSDIANLSHLCFCVNEIPDDEKEIWRLVFFGFTSPMRGVDLKIDQEELDKFEKGNLQFPKIDLDEKLTLENYLKDANIFELVSSDNLGEMIKKRLARRSLLFLIMKVIHEVKPSVNGEPIDQIIRDCFYFRQFDDGNKIKEIRFGPLENFAELWETYVHNLYYINFLEMFFNLLLDVIKHYPMGITVEDIVKSFDIKEIREHLSAKIQNIPNQTTNIQEIGFYLVKNLGGNKTSLKTEVNEKNIALSARKSVTPEEKIANLLILFLLLKHRFGNFSKRQIKGCDFKEEKLFSVVPKRVYTNLEEGDLTDFIKTELTLVKNRHRLIASKKFSLNGTKAWLVTEEDERLYYYGRDYRRTLYREAKWSNVLSLLGDMGLMKVQQDRRCLTELGETWLKKIF